MAGALVTYQLNLAATAKRLSDVYGGSTGQPDPSLDIPYRWLVVQAEKADVWIGDETVTQVKYGVRLGVSNMNEATGHLGPFGSGAVRLSDIWAVGPGATLHILGLRF
jgi:hypothetical protein